MPSTTSVLSTYTTLSGSALLVQSMLNEESVEGKKGEHRSIELSFPRNIMGKVLNSYLPYVMERSVAIKEENKVVKLYTLGNLKDIDCSIEFQTNKQENDQGENQLTSRGLLNFIDGLQSSCGDERIIVFTTNHEDRLDPSLLRSRRMNLDIHISYCTPCGFLASNYLGVSNHSLFTEVEKPIREVKLTPAGIAEELMKSEDANIALEGLIEFLKRVKCWRTEMKNPTIAEIQEIGRDEEDIYDRIAAPKIFGSFPHQSK
ncbi:unnamed protein product, partial [Vitis vinifera]